MGKAAAWTRIVEPQAVALRCSSPAATLRFPFPQGRDSSGAIH